MPRLVASGLSEAEFIRLAANKPSKTPSSPAVEKAAPPLSWQQVIAMVAISLSAVLFSGITFGWAGLQRLLLEEGVYACDNESGADSEVVSEDACGRQLVQLNLVFTLAQFCHVVSSLPVGFLLDNPRFGIEGTSAIGFGLLGTGLFLLSNVGSGGSGSSKVLPAMLFIGAGGPMVFFPLLRRSAQFPGWEAFTITLLNSLFDASAAVFVFGLVAYQEGVSRSTLFVSMGTLAFVSIPVSVAVTALLKSSSASVSTPPQTAGPELKATANTPPDVATLIKSTEFVALVSFASVHCLRGTQYLGTVGDALAAMGDDEGKGVQILGYMLPLGVFTTPLVGRLIDNVGPWNSLIATNIVGVFQCISCTALPLSLQPISFAVYGEFR